MRKNRAALVRYEQIGGRCRIIGSNTEVFAQALTGVSNFDHTREHYWAATEITEAYTEKELLKWTLSGQVTLRSLGIKKEGTMLKKETRVIGETYLQLGKMDELKISISSDSDVIAARQRGCALAERIGFDGTDLTLISTLISEMARTLVRRALPGTISMAATEEAGNVGIAVVASVCLGKNASESKLSHLPPLLDQELLLRAVPPIDGIKISFQQHEAILTMMKRDSGNRAVAPLMMGWRP